MQRKKTIICIVGNSGSGKTTLSKYLNDVFGWPYVASYTTRPMREGETDGVEHTFVDIVPDKSEMIAYTKFGGYEYWATHSQINNDPTVYVIDEKGLDYLKEKFSDEYNIFAIYIMREHRDNIDEERKNRDYDRVAFDRNEYYNVYNNNYDNVDDFLKEVSKQILSDFYGFQFKMITN